DLEEAFSLAKTDKETILESIYEDFDYASEHLPLSYPGSEVSRGTKGAALALKARIALYSEDWTTARDAAKACMELGAYSLFSDFEKLFLSSAGFTSENIVSIPQSASLGEYKSNI